MDDRAKEQEILLNALVERLVVDGCDHHDRNVGGKDSKLLPLESPREEDAREGDCVGDDKRKKVEHLQFKVVADSLRG